MIKVSVPQAKALARKIIAELSAQNDARRDAIRKEAEGTQKYQEIVSYFTAISEDLYHHVVDFGLNPAQSSIRINGNYCYDNLKEYAEKPNGFEEYGKMLAHYWVNHYISERYTHVSPPSESSLVDDIILEALEADSIASIIDKFVAKYDTNPA